MIEYDFTDGEMKETKRLFKNASLEYGLTVLEPDEDDRVALMLKSDVKVKRYYSRGVLHPDVAAGTLPPDMHAKALATTITVLVQRLVDKMDEDSVDGPILVTYFDLRLRCLGESPSMNGQAHMYFVVHFIPQYFRD